MLYPVDVWFSPIRRKTGQKRKAGSVGFASKMARVQWMATLSITGAMKMTPNDLLEAHADVAPMGMIANEYCFRAGGRHSMLGETHPLHKPICRARRYVKQH